MKALVIARTSVVRTLRDRMGLFFVVVLPIILIVVLGMTYGGMSAARVGVADPDGGPLARSLVSDISAQGLKIDVRRFASVADLRDAVERGFVELGVAIPEDYDRALSSGGTATVTYVALPKSIASTVRTAVDAAVADQVSLVRAARVAASANGVPFDRALLAAGQRQPSVAGVAIEVQAVSDTVSNPNGFNVGAESQVILFMFMTSLTGAETIVVTRQLGISRRMYSTPTSAATIVLGEMLGRFAFALFQGLFIVVASTLLFGVDWIDPLATMAIITSFALVASGAAMLLGTVASTTSQAGAIGAALGMLFGLLGGTMVPLEVFPVAMRTIAHLTPHAWAIDAFHDLLLNGSGIGRVLPEIGVLLLFAVAIVAVASLRFRQAIVRGAT